MIVEGYGLRRSDGAEVSDKDVEEESSKG